MYQTNTFHLAGLVKLSIHERRQVKGFLKGTSATRVGKLLNPSSNQVGILTLLITENCHLKRHLLKIELVDSSGCGRYNQAVEMASQVLCDCEELMALRFRHLSCHFFTPGDVNISVSKVLHFAESVWLFNAQVNGCTEDQKWWKWEGGCGASPNVFYTFNLKWQYTWYTVSSIKYTW